MAVFNEPQKWAQTLGKDADVVKIPDIAGDTDPSIDKIFPSVFSIPLANGGRAIPRSVLNGLFKLLGDWVYYIQNGGIASYSNTFDYAVGSFVKYNNQLYICIQANGASSTVKAPTDTEYWLRVALNNDLANYLPLAGGNLTGNLTVQNKNVVRSVNGVNADAMGDVSDIVERGSNYIRYANGIQICWGQLTKYTITAENHESDCTLPKPFKDINYTVQTTARGIGDDFLHVEVSPKNSSSFSCSFIVLRAYSNGTVKAEWGNYENPYLSLYLAVGYWK